MLGVCEKGPNSAGNREIFENIHYNQSRYPGECRFNDSGVGWKSKSAKNIGKPWTLDRGDINSAIWSRASKGYELRIVIQSPDDPKAAPTIAQLDGFVEGATEKVTKIFKNWYRVPFDTKVHTVRGWNWGKFELGNQEIAFTCQNVPVFEIPYHRVLNASVTKKEVALDFQLENIKDPNETEFGEVLATKPTSGPEELLEMRLYIPGTHTRPRNKDDEDEYVDDDGMVLEEIAAHFHDTIVDKANIGHIAGSTFATFPDILFLTPRGRYSLDFFETSMRLRGKTQTFNITFEQIKKYMLLAKPDEAQSLICCGLDPPLIQGRTHYQFLVMQLKDDEEVNIELNMTEEQLQSEQYKGKLDPMYEGPVANVISRVFRGVARKKIISASKEFKPMNPQISAIKCSVKASEGLLYFLDKSFLFVPKPAIYVPFDSIANVSFSRIGGAMATSRTFDIIMNLKDGTIHQFSNVNRQELPDVEDFMEKKPIKVSKPMSDDHDDEILRAGQGSDDDESDDEDFQSSSESEVAEEFDENHEYSGSDDQDNGDNDDDDDVVESEVEDKKNKTKKKSPANLVERPKKKQKK